MRYKVVHTAVLHGGEYYARPERVEAGAEILLTEAEAARLGDNVVPVGETGEVSTQPLPATAEPIRKGGKAKPVKTAEAEG